jgi:hypothetical protein
MGRIVADAKCTGMWRIALPSGRTSDMANLSWAKSLALEAAEREVIYEASRHPPKCPENGGVFGGSSSLVRQNRRVAG